MGFYAFIYIYRFIGSNYTIKNKKPCTKVRLFLDHLVFNVCCKNENASMTGVFLIRQKRKTIRFKKKILYRPRQIYM